MPIKDEQYGKRLEAIAKNQDLTINQKRVAAGKLTRETVFTYKDQGKTNAEIADLLGVPENHIRRTIERGRPLNMIVADQNLSINDEFTIDGPWGHKNLAGLRTPVFVFVPGGNKIVVGEAIVNTENGMKFDIELHEDYKDIDTASFEIPMRFSIRTKKTN